MTASTPSSAALAVNILGHANIRVTHAVPTISGLALSHIWLECIVRKPYRTNWPSTNLRKFCSPTFAGELDFGCVGATSATDLPMLWFVGVARKA
jgi:hypothetical protein